MIIIDLDVINIKCQLVINRIEYLMPEKLSIDLKIINDKCGSLKVPIIHKSFIKCSCEEEMIIEADSLIEMQEDETIELKYDIELSKWIKNNQDIILDVSMNWLPIATNKESILCFHENSVLIDKEIYITNMEDGIFAEDAMILIKPNGNIRTIIEVYNNEYKVYDDLFDHYGYKIDELNKMVKFYNEVFNKDLNFNVYIANTDNDAVSYRNIIIFNYSFYNRPLTFMYKYLPHEIIHQVNGCIVKYKGLGKEWLKESLTEYVQLIFLRERFGQEFYNIQFKYYITLDTISNTENPITIGSFNISKNYKNFKSLICGRGVRLFSILFDENTEKEKICAIFSYIENMNCRINIDDFMMIVEKVIRIDINAFMKKYIKHNYL